MLGLFGSRLELVDHRLARGGDGAQQDLHAHGVVEGVREKNEWREPERLGEVLRERNGLRLASEKALYRARRVPSGAFRHCRKLVSDLCQLHLASSEARQGHPPSGDDDRVVALLCRHSPYLTMPSFLRVKQRECLPRSSIACHGIGEVLR